MACKASDSGEVLGTNPAVCLQVDSVEDRITILMTALATSFTDPFLRFGMVGADL